MSFWLGVLISVLEMALASIIYMLIVLVINKGHEDKEILEDGKQLIEKRCGQILARYEKLDIKTQVKTYKK